MENISTYEYQLEEQGPNDFLISHVCVTILLCFPLASDILTAVVLCKPNIRNIFGGFFGTQMMMLTITEIFTCITFQILLILQILMSFRYRFSLKICFNLIAVIDWIVLALTNWIVALVCVFQCKNDSTTASSSDRIHLCFSVSLGVCGAVILVLSSCFQFIMMHSVSSILYWPLQVSVVTLPFVITLISAGFLYLKVRKNSEQRTIQNKIALILACFFTLVNVNLIILSIIRYFMMQALVPYGLPFTRFIWRSVINIITPLSLVFIFSSASKAFRLETIACLRCKQAANTDVIPMIDTQS